MDDNAHISTDDYANLFLVPRDVCNIQHDISPGTTALPECTSSSPGCNTLTTACPALESLTLVLWYARLLIDADFLAAMPHLRKHHPKLERLQLMSRRLRCNVEVRDARGRHKIEQWFRDDVLPVLRSAAETLLKHKLQVTVYILTQHKEPIEFIQHSIRSYWTPVLEEYLKDHRADVRGELVVEPLDVAQYSPHFVYSEASILHRAAVRWHLFCDPVSTQPASWADLLGLGRFLRRKPYSR